MTHSKESEIKLQSLLEENIKLKQQLRELTNASWSADNSTQSGSKVVAILGGMVILALVTACTLFYTAKYKRNIRNAALAEAIKYIPPQRIDTAGEYISRQLWICASEAKLVHQTQIKTRFKLTPTGTLITILVDAKPEDATLVRCIRQIPSHTKLSESPNDPPVDLNVEFETKKEPDNRTIMHSKWSSAVPQ